MPKHNKRHNMIEHTRRRAWERHQLQLDVSDINAIVNLIQAGKSNLACRLSSQRSLHELSFRGCLLRVIYDRQRKTLNTILPARHRPGTQDSHSAPNVPLAPD